MSRDGNRLQSRPGHVDDIHARPLSGYSMCEVVSSAAAATAAAERCDVAREPRVVLARFWLRGRCCAVLLHLLVVTRQCISYILDGNRSGRSNDHIVAQHAISVVQV
jgi:hypothetical protein